jgi:S1-C subfamily serine protease
VGGDGFGPSDHSAFYAAGVPVLHFFTGAHSDYHRPSDDLVRINAAGAAQIAGVVADVAAAASDREARLGYKSAPVPSPARGDVRSAGASLGTIPDYTEPPGSAPGLRVSGVRPGGPAAQAGLVAGDRIVRIGKSDIRGIHDLEFVLRRARPGEKATLVYERDGKRTQVDVTFSARQRR